MEKKPLTASSSTYFKLIEAVGVSGNYQNLIIVFSFIICFLNARFSADMTTLIWLMFIMMTVQYLPMCYLKPVV